MERCIGNSYPRLEFATGPHGASADSRDFPEIPRRSCLVSELCKVEAWLDIDPRPGHRKRKLGCCRMRKCATHNAFTHPRIRAKAPPVGIEPAALTPRGPEYYETYKKIF